MSKPPTTFEQQLLLLESRGLIVSDRPLALHRLAHANYFRLNCYRHPLQIPGTDTFSPGSQFDVLWEIYRFDHLFRILMLDAIERCEISFRTQWAYVLAHAHGPQAYENPAIHRDPSTHQKTLSKIDTEIRRSTEDFLSPHRGIGTMRPPTWMVCEVMSLGQLSALYDNLAAPADRQAIADAYGFDEKVLRSFLHHLTVVRNVCAHHARLWNRRFAVTFTLPRKKPATLLAQFHSDTRAIYNTLVVLIGLLDIIEPGQHWANRLIKLLSDHSWDITPHMGFPPDWRERTLWKQHLP
jgi:abortive infection bacteriophage resistance protein